MGLVVDIPASGATTIPANAVAAKTLFIDVMNAVYDETSDESFYSASNFGARATQTIPREDLSFTGPCGTGTITVEGYYEGSVTFPDEGWVAKANTTYNNFMASIIEMVMNGTIEAGTVTVGLETYTISGKFVNNLEMDMNLDLLVGSSEADTDYNMDMYLAFEYGAAVSIRSSAGLGAKYLLSYAGEVDENNISMDYMSLDSESQLEDNTANLKVYNDVNDLLFDINIPITEIPGAAF